MSSINDYKENGDSLNLKTIDGQKFTIVDWERSDYEQNGESTKGIKFTTEEKFDNDLNKLHTTRMVIVQKFFKTKNGETIPTKLGEAVKAGEKFTVKSVLKQPEKKGGKEYYDLVDATNDSKDGSLD